MSRRLTRGASAVAVLVLLLGACSDDDDEATRDDSGKVTGAGMVSVFELQPADCLDPPPDLSGDIATILVVPCADPHTQEVFAVVESTADGYPGPEALAIDANGLCFADMQATFGLSPDDGYFISYLLPSFDGWNTDGDRSIVCVFVFPTLGRVTGSVVEQARAGTIEPGSPPPVAPAPLDADAGAATLAPWVSW